MPNLGFVGLGVMGSRIVPRLLEKRIHYWTFGHTRARYFGSLQAGATVYPLSRIKETDQLG